MSHLKFNNIITKIKTNTTACILENHHLDFKRFPISSHQNDRKKKLSSFLREYTVAFANSNWGTLLLRMEKSTTGPEAITDYQNYSIEEMRQMIFNGTRSSIITEIKELPQREGMVLVDKTAFHLEPIDYDRWAELELKDKLTMGEMEEKQALEKKNIAFVERVYQRLREDKSASVGEGRMMYLIRKKKNTRDNNGN